MSLPPEVSELLSALLLSIQETLGSTLVGVSLRGSLVKGDFDFLPVTKRPVAAADFSALAAMHARLVQLPNRYAPHLEGVYPWTALISAGGAMGRVGST